MDRIINLINSPDLTLDEKNNIKRWLKIDYNKINHLESLRNQRNLFKKHLYERITLLLQSPYITKEDKDKIIIPYKNKIQELNTYPDLVLKEWRELTENVINQELLKNRVIQYIKKFTY
jgi:hypothetical protein